MVRGVEIPSSTDVIFGALGLTKVKGQKIRTVVGIVTAHCYDFLTKPVQYVDKRDVPGMLEFIDQDGRPYIEVL